jgi:hypothetical protein
MPANIERVGCDESVVADADSLDPGVPINLEHVRPLDGWATMPDSLTVCTRPPPPRTELGICVWKEMKVGHNAISSEMRSIDKLLQLKMAEYAS